MDGVISPHDILKVKGEHAVAEYLANEIQEVYRIQGVAINDKHIEVIVKQMLSKVVIIEPNDANFIIDEQVDKQIFDLENSKVTAKGGNPATSKSLLLGITRVSLKSDGFISAASFQETTKVLTDASFVGTVDYLRGLKENVILGKRIPAGTGLDVYSDASYTVLGELVDDKDKDTFDSDIN